MPHASYRELTGVFDTLHSEFIAWPITLRGLMPLKLPQSMSASDGGGS